MTYKQIEASRELRLWIGQIIVPAVTIGAGIILANPELKRSVSTKFNGIKNSIKYKFKKD